MFIVKCITKLIRFFYFSFSFCHLIVTILFYFYLLLTLLLLCVFFLSVYENAYSSQF